MYPDRLNRGPLMYSGVAYSRGLADQERPAESRPGPGVHWTKSEPLLLPYLQFKEKLMDLEIADVMHWFCGASKGLGKVARSASPRKVSILSCARGRDALERRLRRFASRRSNCPYVAATLRHPEGREVA